MHRLPWLAVAGLLVALTGCKLTVSQQAAPAPASKHPAHAAARPDPKKATAHPKAAARPAAKKAAAPSGGSLRLLVEPRDGLGAIYRLITGARSTVDLTMYELNDKTAEDDLASDAARGVDVKVLLDQHLERSRNEAAYAFLSAHRVHVAWADAETTYHQKTLTVDGATSVIMTLNMVTDDYPGTRDFAVIDTGHADVTAIVATFSADFAHRASRPPDGTDLVWSPTNSQSSILAVINGAHRTLAVENEEMDDSTVTAALERAARRGVDVTVVMTADSEWDTAFAELKSAGVHVRLYPDSSGALYIHAKAVVADAGHPGQQVFVGSENFSEPSLDDNRELGIRTANPAVISAIGAVVAGDYTSA
jgi:cardiolipin synthase A/B